MISKILTVLKAVALLPGVYSAVKKWRRNRAELKRQKLQDSVDARHCGDSIKQSKSGNQARRTRGY